MISIVTICKNSAATIRDTIRSVVDQTYVDWELIVKDGGSTDQTTAIVKSFEDSRIKLHEIPDSGISDAFNQGVSLCAGNFVLFLNSDDRFASSDAMSDFITAAGGIDSLNRESGVYYARSSVLGHPLGIKSIGTPRTGLSLLDYYRWPYQHQAMLFARKLFETVGEFDLSLKYTMDYEWLLRLLEVVTPQYVEVDLIVMDGGGVSNRMRWRTHWERFRVLWRWRGAHVALPWIGYFVAGECVLGLRQLIRS